MPIARAFNRHGGTGSTSSEEVQTITFNNETSLTINHSFDEYPNVIVIDSNGNLVHAEIRYSSSSQILINFAIALSGSVILR